MKGAKVNSYAFMSDMFFSMVGLNCGIVGVILGCIYLNSDGGRFATPGRLEGKLKTFVESTMKFMMILQRKNLVMDGMED